MMIVNSNIAYSVPSSNIKNNVKHQGAGVLMEQC